MFMRPEISLATSAAAGSATRSMYVYSMPSSSSCFLVRRQSPHHSAPNMVMVSDTGMLMLPAYGRRVVRALGAALSWHPVKRWMLHRGQAGFADTEKEER